MNYPTNEQEVFEYVALFLIKQGKQSVDEDGGCMYRGDNGRKCAAGCLIPDKNYHQDMENNPSVAVARRYHDLPEIFVKERRIIEFLQEFHDDKNNWVSIVESLEEFAQDHDLKMPVLP